MIRNCEALIHWFYLTLLMSFLMTACEKVAKVQDDYPVPGTVRLSLRTEQDRRLAMQTCEESVQKVLREPADVGRKVLETLARRFADMDFGEHSYRSRTRSLDEYFKLVMKMADALSASSNLVAEVWNFELDAVDRINREIERCGKEPVGGPYGDVTSGAGGFLTQRGYLSRLKQMRFEWIRKVFETGCFVQYFHAQNDESRSVWIHRLEKIAQRKVVIWNPEKQLDPLPIYVPEDDRDWIVKPDENGEGGIFQEHLGGGRVLKMRDVKRSSPLGDTGSY